MPQGIVKFYDSEKGFGFVIDSETEESVYIPSSALPPSTTELAGGSKIEFSVASGRRGAQVLSLNVLEIPKSIVKAKRKTPKNMIPLIQDLIKVLDESLDDFQRDRYPEDNTSRNIAQLLRAVAKNFDV
jgi:CspA family cold shock protein